MFAKHQPTTPAQTKSPIERPINYSELARWAGSYRALLRLLDKEKGEMRPAHFPFTPNHYTHQLSGQTVTPIN